MPSSDAPWRRMGMAVPIAALLSTTLAFVVAVVIFSLLPISLRQAAGRTNLTPTLSPDGVFYWPVGTAAMLYLSALAWQAAAIRGEARRAEHRLHLGVLAAAAYTASLIPPGLAAMIFLVNRPFAVTPVFALIALVSLALAAYLFVTGLSLSRRARAAVLPEAAEIGPTLIRAVNWREWATLSLALSLVVIGPAIAGAAAVSLNLVLAPVVFIGVLSNYAGPDFDPNLVAGFTSATVARSLYQFQALSALAQIAIAAVVMGAAVGGVRAVAGLLATRAAR